MIHRLPPAASRALSITIQVLIGLLLMDHNFMMIAQTFLDGIANFVYLGIPFFVLLGTVMEKAEVSKPLVDCADELVGYLPVALAMGVIFASAVFAAISGSGPATVAAIGTIAIPEMEKRGYVKSFAVGRSGRRQRAEFSGPSAPPSIPFIIYGVVTEQSIARLFLGGLGAGLVLMFLMMVLCFIKAKSAGVPVSGKRPSARRILQAMGRAKVALIAPAIALGGIYAGICTPTEAGAMGSIYLILMGLFVKRTLTLQGLIECFEKAGKTSAMIMLVIGAAYLPAWLMASWNLPDLGARFILGMSENTHVFLIFVNVLFLVIGSLLDTPAAIVILAPILHPPWAT